MYVPRAIYSLRTSFWTVPDSRSLGTPCSSPRATYRARRIAAVELMVIEVETWSRRIPWKRVRMSSRESMATPTLPTSPAAIAASESYPICVGRSKATDRPVCPRSSR
jgi:hypothetical protein